MPDAWAASIPQPLSSMPLEPLLTRDYDSHPALVHERLRGRFGPVAPVELLGVPVWLALGYNEVLQILQNEGDIWSKHLDHWRWKQEGRVPPDWPLMPVVDLQNSYTQEGAPHLRLREAWSAALAPYQDPAHPQAQMLTQAIGRYADDLINVLAEGASPTGWADLSAQFARPLPLMVCCRLLGLDNDRGDDFLMDVWRVMDAAPDAAVAFQRVMTSITDLAATKMTRPGEDMGSYMLAAVPDLTVEELARELVVLPGMIGDYIGSLICNTVVEVMTNRDVRTSLSQGTIDETMNRVVLASPPFANLSFRFPLVDVKLGRFVIAAGDPVMLSIAGAHADPLFAGTLDPNALRSTRAHLAWGAGPHRCPSQRLATRITAIAVSRLFERFSRVRLALPADQLPWRPSPFIRALRALPVQFELAPNHVPGPAATPGAEPGAPQAGAAPAAGETPRSALWRFLRTLRRER
ncbi:cytochrome P450 [Sphaerisporangium fuscum]|uniref:cytochrome P450 n=1 Tax=Sphaerisporangium fuscum TaxID=2835868 RepID=UPI001BDC2403|nr:cytochrome P450 [Sphaerisporangium fuscum]